MSKYSKCKKADRGGRVAFVEKVFLDRRASASALRGVELFNLRLVRDLCAHGIGVDLFAEPSWHETILREIPGAETLRIVGANGSGSSFLAGLAAAFRVRGLARREGRYDALLLGNVANRLIPALWLLKSGRDFARATLVAHREPSPRFLRSIRRMPGRVVAVSEPVAADFRDQGLAADVVVDYGIMDADLFHPSSRESDEKVRFCVLGALDNAWKGADTAIAAFRLLPDVLRARCELHLMAYRSPPTFPGEPGIIAHPWRGATGIPDFLRTMDVMLVPSRDEHIMRETFSQSVVQGMLTGLPVVYAPIPVLAEKFDCGGGFPAETPEAYAEAMARLAEDSNLRATLGAKGRETALARYVWDTGRFIERHLFPGDAP